MKDIESVLGEYGSVLGALGSADACFRVDERLKINKENATMMSMGILRTLIRGIPMVRMSSLVNGTQINFRG